MGSETRHCLSSENGKYSCASCLGSSWDALRNFSSSLFQTTLIPQNERGFISQIQGSLTLQSVFMSVELRITRMSLSLCILQMRKPKPGEGQRFFPKSHQCVSALCQETNPGLGKSKVSYCLYETWLCEVQSFKGSM